MSVECIKIDGLESSCSGCQKSDVFAEEGLLTLVSFVTWMRLCEVRRRRLTKEGVASLGETFEQQWNKIG